MVPLKFAGRGPTGSAVAKVSLGSDSWKLGGPGIDEVVELELLELELLELELVDELELLELVELVGGQGWPPPWEGRQAARARVRAPATTSACLRGALIRRRCRRSGRRSWAGR